MNRITEIVRLEQFDYYNQKQNEVLYVNMVIMDNDHGNHEL